jgi:transcriptional regulator with XRE-family HTH domain
MLNLHEPRDALAIALAQDRARMGLSQQVLCDTMGISQQTLSRWEAATALPRGHRLIQLKNVMGRDSETWRVVTEMMSAAEQFRTRNMDDSFDTRMYSAHPALMRAHQTPLEMLAKATADMARASLSLARAAESISQAVARLEKTGIRENT